MVQVLHEEIMINNFERQSSNLPVEQTKGTVSRLKPKFSIRLKIILSSIILLFVSISIVTIIHVITLKKYGESEAAFFRQQIYESKQEHLKNLVEVAYKGLGDYYQKVHDLELLKQEASSILKPTVSIAYRIISANFENYSQGKIDEKTAKQNAIDLIHSLRINKNNYFWIHNTEPRMITHPMYPKSKYPEWYKEKGLASFQDSKGVPVFQEMVKLCEERQEGFIDYYWTDPDRKDNVQVPKLSYVKLFKPWNWIVGAGIYLEVETEHAKKQAAELIKNMKYGGQGYYWINDMEPKMIMHPNYPKNQYPEWYEHNGLTNYNDTNGKPIFVEFTKVAKSGGEGFVEYYWTKPGSENKKPVPKLSYVKLFKPWNWIIGSGIYIDDIDIMVEEKRQALNKQIWQNLWQSIFIIAGISIVSFILMIWIANTIVRPIRRVVEYANKISNGFFYTDLKLNTNDETQSLTYAFNTVNRTLTRFQNEIQKLIQHSIEGNLNKRGNPERFSGGYSEILKGMNYLVDVLVNHLERLPIPILTLNRNREILFINESGTRLFQKSAADVKGNLCSNLFKTERCENSDCTCLSCIKENKQIDGKALVNISDQEVALTYTCIPLKEETEYVVGALLFIHLDDIDKKKAGLIDA